MAFDRFGRTIPRDCGGHGVGALARAADCVTSYHRKNLFGDAAGGIRVMPSS
jgi:hypothetical protein